MSPLAQKIELDIGKAGLLSRLCCIEIRLPGRFNGSILTLLLGGFSPLACGTDELAFSAHAGVVSRYVARGITSTYFNGHPLGNENADAPESDSPAAQWGFDIESTRGWYAGYWASMINYSYLRLGQAYSNRSITVFDDRKSIENDLYAGYTASFGDFKLTAGMTGYLYVNGKHSDTAESRFGIGFKNLTFNAQTYLMDSLLGNAGDTYWTLGYQHDLSRGFKFNLTLGWSSYATEGRFYGTRDTFLNIDCAANAAMNVTGCFAGSRPVKHNFTHLTLGMTYDVPSVPVVLEIDGIIGGYNRFDVSQDNEIIGSARLEF